MPSPVGIGIIGTGFRGGNNLASRIAETSRETGFRVAALCDTRPQRLQEVQSRLTAAFARAGVAQPIATFTDYQALIADPAVDLVLVTTPSYAHRDPAVAALRAGKKLYLDKPIAHNLADGVAIVQEEARQNSPMILGFTRRYEAPWRRAYELVQEGAIGKLHMIQIRSVIPYHRYFQRWHRRQEWSGGALNDKSAHHMDVFNWFAGSPAHSLSAIGGRRVFLPEEDAPERCLDCERDCPYRAAPHRRELSDEHPLIQERGRAWIDAEERDRFDTCVYQTGADIKDHASVQIAYTNGVVASLFLSFFGPESPDQETLELVGNRGRILLTRHTGQLDVISDFGSNRETVDCRDEEFSSSHFGADRKLIRELRAFYDGAPPVVGAQSGLEATALVMAAHKSIDSGGAQVRIDELLASHTAA